MIEEDLAMLNTMNINELKKLFLRYFNAHPTLKTKEAYILKLVTAEDYYNQRATTPEHLTRQDRRWKRVCANTKPMRMR